MNKGLAVFIGIVAIGSIVAYAYKDKLKLLVENSGFMSFNGSTESKSTRIEKARYNNCEFVNSHKNN